MDKNSQEKITIELNADEFKKLQKLLELDDVKLEFEQEALEAIVDKAIERKTGARGLRSIIEEIMRDIMFDVPSNPKIEKCIVTKETVLNKKPPELVINEHKEKQLIKDQKQHRRVSRTKKLLRPTFIIIGNIKD